jgi:ribosomal protein S18 acetylase RimI-like enzyme
MDERDFGDGDLRLLLEHTQELWRDDPDDLECTFGQIAFWSAQLPRSDWAARLWFDDGRLVAWGWLSRGEELEFQVRPSHGSLLDEILDWARPTELLVRADRPAAIERIRAHGLEHAPGEPWMRVNRRSLRDLEEPSPPAGYRVTTMAEHGDFASRSAAHRTAFSPSRFTDEVYAVVRETWPYRADLDCVVVAPDGSVAAYALAWLDELNGLGELEPVGTHEDHRGLGLGRAVNLFALRRLRDEGATEALVQCRGDEAYPIPRKLYESVGFRELWRTLPFRATTGSPVTLALVRRESDLSQTHVRLMGP